ncbi:unnamed protein product [Ectocarpus sp. 12 AP-2014]
MRASGWKGWMLLGLCACGEAFVVRPLVYLPTSSVSASTTTTITTPGAAAPARCSRGPQQQKQRRDRAATALASSQPSMMQDERQQQEFAAKVAPKPGDPSEDEAKKAAAVVFVPEVANNQLTSEVVEVDEISGRRLIVEFKAFGYFKRTCQLELLKSGDCVFSKGMVAKEKGAWRVEEEEGTDYLQFSCPLTEMYGVMFDVPSALLFWRVPLRKGADGSVVLQGGQIISEKNSLFGLKTTFIDEGTFKARVLADDEEFPVPDKIDFSSVPIPAGLAKLKKKGKGGITEQVPEPPLPGSR